MTRLDSPDPVDDSRIEQGLAFAFGSRAHSRPSRREPHPGPLDPARLESARHWQERVAREIEPAGRYKFLGILGRGGQGIVLLCLDLELDREVAIKILREGLPLALRQRLIQEARIYSKLDHPAIVPIFDAGELGGGSPYLVMKLVRGKTLTRLLSEKSGQAPDTHELLLLFEAICQAIAYAHDQGVIHCDLKPSNIMVGFFGEVRVLDWGLARILDEHARAGRREASPLDLGAGTPGYMSPEQARGDEPGTSSDVFGLGAILCEILTGEPPVSGQDTLSVLAHSQVTDLETALGRLRASGAPPELVQLACQCLDPDPARRPARAREVAVKMREYFEGVKLRSQARMLARGTHELRHRGRRHLLRLTFLTVLLLIVAGCVLGFLVVQDGQQSRHLRSLVETALRETSRSLERAADPARGDPLDRETWRDLGEQIRQVRDLGGEHLEPGARERVEAFEERALALVRRVQAHQRLVDSLRNIWAEPPGEELLQEREARHAEFFEGILGPGWIRDDLDDVVERLGGRVAGRVLISLIDDWCQVRRRLSPGDALSVRLGELGQHLDPDERLRPVRELSFAGADRLRSYAVLTRVERRLEAGTASAHAWRTLGQAWLHGGWVEEAERVYLEGLRRHPTDTTLHLLQGLLWRASRAPGVVVELAPYRPYLQFASARCPDDAWLRDELGRLEVRLAGSDAPAR